MTNTEYYDVLDIKKPSNENEIKKAYRKLALKWHPDKNNNDKEASEKFKKICEAYSVLSNPEKKKQYDSYGKKKPPKNSGFSGVSFSFKKGSGIPPIDIFEQFFGTKNIERAEHSNFGFPAYHHTSLKKRKGDLVEVDLVIPLEKLYTGTTKKLKITRTDYTVFPPKAETVPISVQIQPGWKGGTKITHKNLGDTKPNEYTSDIVFIVREKEHPVFMRKGDDLYAQFIIDLEEALNGINKTIKCLDGNEYPIKNFKPKYSNENFVLHGKGMPVREVVDGEKKIVGNGDVIISFIVKFHDKKLIGNNE